MGTRFNMLKFFVLSLLVIASAEGASDRKDCSEFEFESPLPCGDDQKLCVKLNPNIKKRKTEPCVQYCISKMRKVRGRDCEAYCPHSNENCIWMNDKGCPKPYC